MKIISKSCIFLVGVMLGVVQAASAECINDQAEEIAQRYAHYDVGTMTNAFLDCRALPDSSDTGAVVVHYPAGRQAGSEHVGLDVVLYDLKTGKLIAKYVSPGEYVIDPSTAFYLDVVSFDMARYFLSAGVRAFGVRADMESTKLNSSYELINLFVAANGQVSPVLKGLVVEKRINKNLIRRTLAIGDGVSHGYADIIVREKEVPAFDDGAGLNSASYHERILGRKQYVIRYDGRRYVLPQELTSELQPQK